MASTRFSQGAARRGCRVFLERLSRLIRCQRKQRVVIDGIDVSGFSIELQERIAQALFDGMKLQSFTSNGWKYLRHDASDDPDVRELMDFAETVRNNHRERCAEALERQSEINIIKSLIAAATTATDAEEPPPFDAKTFEETKIALENEKNDLGMKYLMAAELGRQRRRFQRNNEYVKWDAHS